MGARPDRVPVRGLLDSGTPGSRRGRAGEFFHRSGLRGFAWAQGAPRRASAISGGGRLGGLFRHGGLRLGFGFQIGHIESVQPAQLDGHVFVDGAGVRLLFGDAQFGEPVQDFVSLDFQLPRQLVDSNLLHRKNYLSLPPRRSYHVRPGSGTRRCAPGALFRSGPFRARSFRRIVSGGTRVFYRTRLFRRFRFRQFRRRLRGRFQRGFGLRLARRSAAASAAAGRALVTVAPASPRLAAAPRGRLRPPGPRTGCSRRSPPAGSAPPSPGPMPGICFEFFRASCRPASRWCRCRLPAASPPLSRPGRNRSARKPARPAPPARPSAIPLPAASLPRS